MNRASRTAGLLMPLAAAIVLAASCASGPPEPAAAPAPEPAALPAQAAPGEPDAGLDALLADAKALKKKAFDLKLYEELGDDYRAADALLAKGQEAYDAGDGAAARDRLEAAAAAFRSLIGKGLSELTSIRKREAEDMRTRAIEAEAEGRAADRLEAGDEAFVGAESLAMDGEAEGSIAAYEGARLFYEIAYRRSTASALADEIEAKDYSRWDSGNYALAMEKLEAEEALWSSEDAVRRAEALDALEEAILRLNLVIQIGRESIASAARENAEASKYRSDDIKAGVAAREEYESALSAMGDADSLFKLKEYEAAAEAYALSMSAFDRAFEIAAEKRTRASEAMRRAEEAAADSGRKADEADPIVNADLP